MRNRELPQHVHAGAHYILVTLGALGKGAVTVMFLLLDWKSGSLKVQGVPWCGIAGSVVMVVMGILQLLPPAYRRSLMQGFGTHALE